MEHKSGHTQKSEDSPHQTTHSQHGSDGHAVHQQEKKPWTHDEQQYASLVNVAGSLKTFGWGILALLSAVGLIFVGAGFVVDSFTNKMLVLGSGLGFILTGLVVKNVWGVLSEMVTLMIEIANDLHAIRMK